MRDGHPYQPDSGILAVRELALIYRNPSVFFPANARFSISVLRTTAHDTIKHGRRIVNPVRAVVTFRWLIRFYSKLPTDSLQQSLTQSIQSGHDIQ